MLIWLIKDGEFLPIQSGSRPMRTGLLANELIRRGHSVVWWHSTFSHQTKQLLSSGDCEFSIRPNFKLKLLHGGSYLRHLSIRRSLHYRRVALKFRRLCALEKQPDAIVCALPQIGLASEAVKYANQRGIPVLVDVRDPWPEVFVEFTPAGLRPIARVALHRAYRKTRRLLSHANGIVAVSRGFLQWALALANRSQLPTDAVVHIGYSPTLGEIPACSRAEALRSELRGKILFTFAGQFGHSYQLESVAEAAARLQQRAANIHFVLIGAGDQFSALARRAKGLRNLTLTGWLTPGEVAEILRFSHVGLMPGHRVKDTVPNKPFEYMAYGLPLLSSLRGEMAELIEKFQLGLNYRQGDVRHLCQQAELLANAPELLKQLSNNCSGSFRDHFHSDRLYAKFAEHIELTSGMTTRPSAGMN